MNKILFVPQMNFLSLNMFPSFARIFFSIIVLHGGGKAVLTEILLSGLFYHYEAGSKATQSSIER